MNILRLGPVTLLLAGLMCAASAAAQERILSFFSEIRIAADASMQVQETIRVSAEGKQIQRGIYRDFPTDYTDQYGNAYKVDFEMLDVTRDGLPEQWRSERRANGVRTYIGAQNTRLKPGEYSYTLRYTTHRQIGFFPGHDELYWNVTGNGWAFPIAQASAVVILHRPVPAANIDMQGFTGSAGSKQQDYVTTITDGKASIQTTRPLEAAQGLTLVASWPKGVVREPDRWQQLVYLLRDNRGLLLALAALLLSGLYLHFLWLRYGRDPQPGVIFARYEPPERYSPASARYVSKMRYDGTVLAAAVINLAVKGYVSITKTGRNFQLQRKSSSADLAPGESALLSLLFVGGPDLKLDKKNHSIIGRAKSAHMRALQRDYLNIYFRRNTGKIVPSALGSLATVVVIGILQAFSPLVIALLAVNALMHGLYVYLLHTPTPRGRLLLDQLMGFKLYLEVAEKEDLDRRHPPEKTPELFERFMPFAVALGVEQAWAEQFAGVFEHLEGRQSTAYRPLWYSGQFNAAQLGSFAGEVGDSFSAAISSAATPPGSSSGGGGGGSSGGGGGGGGGGGW